MGVAKNASEKIENGNLMWILSEIPAALVLRIPPYDGACVGEIHARMLLVIADQVVEIPNRFLARHKG